MVHRQKLARDLKLHVTVETLPPLPSPHRCLMACELKLAELQQPARGGNGKNARFPQPQVPDSAGTETDGA